MNCSICGKKGSAPFCEWHGLAYENLKEKFGAWRKALSIGWEEFLAEVEKNPNAGVWAKEVARYLLKKAEG